MKKSLMITIVLLGLLVLAFCAFAENRGAVAANMVSGTVVETDAARACPNCSGDAPVIADHEFESGDNCTCVGNNSLTIGPNVIVKKGATVTFQSPEIAIKNPTTFEPGAAVKLFWLIEPISITLSAEPAGIAADGSSTSSITGTFKDGAGNPVPKGASVTFRTDLGTFPNGSQEYTAKTIDATGTVTLFLLAGTTAGTATVKASLGTSTQSVDVTLLEIPKSAAFELSTTQATIKSDNSESATITATVLDAANAGFPGATVSFTADGGQLSASSAITDLNGQASITISSGTINKSNRVITVSGTVANVGTRTIQVQVVGSSLTMSSDKTNITDDGETFGELTVTAGDAGGMPVYNALIRFSFDPDDTGTAKISPANALTYPFTDVSGQLKVFVKGATPGSVTVNASGLGSTASQSYTVSHVDMEYTITLSAEPSDIAADGSSTSSITGTFKDGAGNPVPNDTSVTFTTDLGTFPNGSQEYTMKTTDATGTLMLVLQAGTTAGTATVKASLGTSTQEVQIVIYGKAPAEVVLEAEPKTLNADGVSRSAIRASVIDDTGSAVSDGTLVSFGVTTGTGNLSAAGVATNGGVAIVTYTASTTAGTETVIAATSNGKTKSVDMTLLRIAEPAAFELSINQATIKSDNSESATITATVLDAANAGFPGATVSFTADGGQLSASSAITDLNGKASITISSGTINKSNRVITVSGTVANVGTRTIQVQVVGSSLTTSSDKTNITDDGATFAELTVTAGDAGGKPVNNALITFSFDPGDTGTAKISAVNPLTYPFTDVSGQLKVYVKGVTPGSVTVNASGLGSAASQVYTVSHVAMEYTITLSAEPAGIAADGSSYSIVTGTFKDGAGNPVPKDTSVAFTTDLGTFSNGLQEYIMKTYDATGIVTLFLRAGTTAGTATVKASLGTTTKETQIVIYSKVSAEMVLTAEPKTLNADGMSTSTIRASVTDATGSAVPDGTLVSFSVTTGTGSLSAGKATTNGGVATVTYTASMTVGTETVMAATSNGKTKSVDIILISVVVGTVDVTAGTTSIVADGTSNTVIRATVKAVNGDNIPDGTAVSFTTTAGALSIPTTTVNGVATVTLTSPKIVGSATVIATCDGVSDSTTITFIPGPVGILSLTAVPNNLSADGTSKCTIRAYVTDVNSNAVNGETIRFRVTTGTGQLSPSTAVTVDGVASVTYTASTTAGVEKVTADATNGILKTLNITLVNANVGDIQVTSGKDWMNADGASTTLISATVTDIKGNAVPSGTAVSFATTAGVLSDATAATTNGIATVILTSGTTAETATVTGTCGGLNDTVTVKFIAGPVDTVTVLATPDNLTADGVSTSSIKATAVDANNNPVSGETLTFSAELGELSWITDLTDANGVATVTYTAPIGSAGSPDTVTATSTNSKTGSDKITLVDASVGDIQVSAGKSELIANGSASTIITARVWDLNGNAVANNTAVTFAATAGILSGETTTTNGVATATLTSSKAACTLTVTGTCGNLNDTVNVKFIAGPVDTVTVLATPDNLTADGVSTSSIKATAVDANNNPVSGETLTFSAELGELSWITDLTDANGVATVTYTAPIGSAGSPDTVTATSTNSKTGSDKITLVDASVGDIQVSAGKSELIANGSASTIITARVWDLNGNAVVDNTPVTFGTTAGTYSEETTTTNGIATAILTSSTTACTVTVTGTCGNLNDTVNVEFIAGPVATVTVVADPDNVTADGVSTSTIKATAKDANANPVLGETLNFSADLGDLSAITAITGTNGVATVTYTAPVGSAGSPDTVMATSTNSKTGSDKITLVDASVGSVAVMAGTSSLVADGSSTTIFATVKDVNGNNIADGTAVTFSATAGALFSITTTINGIATARLTSATNLGTATVTATAGGLSSSVIITFVAGPPETVYVVATPANLTADGTSTSTINITVLDAKSNPVADGTTLTISADYGTLSNLTAITAGGKATVKYTAPSSTPTTKEDVITVVTINNKSKTATINLSGPQIATITLSADPTSLPADGKSTATITATVTLSGGGTPPDGTTVNFSITPPGGGSITASSTTANGSAFATLTSAAVSGTATIRAESGGRTAQINVDYAPGSVTITIIPNSILGTGDKESTVTALVENAAGTPQVGENVTFTLNNKSLGTITPTVKATDANGEAVVQFDGAATGGTATVTASWTTGTVDVTGSADVVVQPPPAFIQTAAGYPTPSAINIRGTGGQSTSQIAFDVKDTAGNLVVDGYRVDFAITTGPNGGEKISPLFATTVNGKVTTILESGTKSGPVSLKATYYHDTNVSTVTGQITIVAGPPVGEEFGVSAKYRNISGLHVLGLQDIITLSAGDIYGNAIPDNTALSFKTYNTGGLFNPGSSTTTGGTTSNPLLSVSTPLPQQGFVSVTGEAINGGRTTHVTCIDVASGAANIVYAGTDGGGVYKSTNSGVSWNNVSRSSTTPGQNWLDTYVNDIAVDPDNNNTVFAATGYLANGHVYRSFDGAGTWNSNNPEEFQGIFSDDAAVLTILSDDVGTYLWVGTQGDGVYFTKDATATPVVWTQASTGLGSGTTIEDIVKVPNTHGATAILYAGTARGVYQSTNGGIDWNEPGYFIGDNIAALALHPSSTGGAADVIYAGTKDAGLWFSGDSGGTWTQKISGLGKGLSASTPLAAVTNTGTGIMDPVTVMDDAKTENWSVTCIKAIADSGLFSVTGSVSGLQTDYKISKGLYTIPNVLSFTIQDGLTDFVVGDTFTFSTTRDPGLEIKDLLVDEGNNRLYAITYFWGSLETHAVGNVYSIGLGAAPSYEPVLSWTEQTTGLPQYDPPDDTTLFAQHALASNIPSYKSGAATALYIGGEGINFYKATTDLIVGTPVWNQSKSGLTNLVMTRMPVLFSGACYMDVTETATADPNVYNYTIYIQDNNGNPPIKGSLFTIETYDSFGVLLSTVYSVNYPDVYTYQGTWSNPNDGGTDKPYERAIDFSGQVAEVKFSFIPICSDTVPGCSGSEQVESKFHTATTVPSVTTTTTTALTATTASSGGNVTDDGGSAVTARGVCWNTTGSPDIYDSKTNDGSGIGSYGSSITGLLTTTTYYVRAYATSSYGTGYGIQRSIITP